MNPWGYPAAPFLCPTNIARNRNIGINENEKRKKFKKNFEKESKNIETKEVEVSPIFEKVLEDIKKVEVVDKDIQEILVLEEP